MVVDSEWDAMEKEEVELGYFDQFGTFVKEEHLLEVALESIEKDGMMKDRFVSLICDYIDSNEDAKERFLKWYYPEYGKE